MFFLGIEGLVLMDEIGTIDKFSEAQIVEEVVDLNLSKRVLIATPELRSFGASEVSYVNGLGFNFDVAPSLVGIWCPLIYEVGDVGDVGGSE